MAIVALGRFAPMHSDKVFGKTGYLFDSLIFTVGRSHPKPFWRSTSRCRTREEVANDEGLDDLFPDGLADHSVP